jgi:hypothetical protein
MTRRSSAGFSKYPKEVKRLIQIERVQPAELAHVGLHELDLQALFPRLLVSPA